MLNNSKHQGNESTRGKGIRADSHRPDWATLMLSTPSSYKTFDSTPVFEYLVKLLWGIALTPLDGIVEPI